MWFLNRQEGSIRYITYQDFACDPRLMAGLALDDTGGNRHEERASALLSEGLKRAVECGTLLEARLEASPPEDSFYLLNTPSSRAAYQAWQQGEWSPGTLAMLPVSLEQDPPNIFRLYEENIGLLTPLIADALHDAEQTYPAAWIKDAMRIAVTNNARSWRYVEKILQAWKDKGRDEANRRDTATGKRRFDQGEFSEFIER
ncbi:MAG: DnaD domain protein [Anaerolineaceae bacterium]|nr:DnaD domain protein [Anaerolineaceae bacterium]